MTHPTLSTLSVPPVFPHFTCVHPCWVATLLMSSADWTGACIQSVLTVPLSFYLERIKFLLCLQADVSMFRVIGAWTNLLDMVEKKSRVSVFNKTNILNGKSSLAREGSLYWVREAAKARTCLEAHSVIVPGMSKIWQSQGHKDRKWNNGSEGGWRHSVTYN